MVPIKACRARPCFKGDYVWEDGVGVCGCVAGVWQVNMDVGECGGGRRWVSVGGCVDVGAGC